MRISAVVSFCLLLTSLARAEIQRTEIAQRGGWTINACNENGKPRGAEMWRTYDAKQEVHLRVRTNQEGVFIDASGDWSDLPNAKTQAAEIRINSSRGTPLWAGEAKVVKDDDGLPWLRANLSKSAEGDVTECVLEAMMERGETLSVSIGKKPQAALWNFDLSGAKAAYDAMWEYLQESGAAAAK